MGMGVVGRWAARSISNRIALAAVLLTLVFVLITGSASFYYTRQLLTRNITTELHDMGQLLAERLQGRVGAEVEGLQALSNNTLVANGLVDSSGRGIYLEPFLRDYRVDDRMLASVCLTDFQGAPIACRESSMADYRGRPWVSAVVDGNKVHVALLPDDENAASLLLAYPVIFRSTGLPEGMLVARLDLRVSFNEAVGVARENRMVQLLSRNRLILACSACAAAPDGEDFLQHRVELSLDPVLAGLKLSLKLVEPTASAFAPLRVLSWGYVAVLLTLVPLVLWLANLGSRHLTGSLRRLTDTAEQVAADGPLAMPPLTCGVDEVGQLSASFGRMLEHLRSAHEQLEQRVLERTAELRQRELDLATQRRDYRTILDSVPAMIFYLDGNGRVIRVNRVAEKYSGMSVERMLGQSLYSMFSTEQARVLQQENDRVIATGEALIGQLRELPDAEGGTRWFQVDKIPFRDEEGQAVGVILVASDVTERVVARQAVEESEERYRQLVEGSPDAIVVHNPQGILYTSPEGVWLFGADDAERVVGRKLREFLLPEYRGLLDRSLAGIVGERRRGSLVEVRLQRLDGTVLDVEVSGMPVLYGGQPAAQLVMRDVTERKRVEEKMRLAAKVFDNTREGIMITDAQRRIIAVNRAFAEITGYASDDVLGQEPSILKSGHHDEEFYRHMWNTLNEADEWQGEIWNRRQEGGVYPQWLSIAAVRDEQQRLTHYVSVFSDITTVKAAERKLQHLAYYDPLTGLPNRTLFEERLNHALVQHKRQHHPLAVMFLDLDHFKPVNDSLGHDAGDLLLKAVAERIGACLREGDTVARQGGDEFTVLLERPGGGDEIVDVARRILAALTHHFEISGKRVFSGASIGIALYPQDGESVDTLLKHADAAMYRAKNNGRNGFVMYHDLPPTNVAQTVSLAERRGVKGMPEDDPA